MAGLLLAGCGVEPEMAEPAEKEVIAPEDVTPDKPLGFRMGMTREDLRGVEEKGSDWFRAQGVVGKADNRLFDFYDVKFSDAEGLCMVEAVGRDVSDAGDGVEVRKEADRLRQALARSYGQPNVVELDVTEEGEALGWLAGIGAESRDYRFCWTEETVDYAHNIESICLKVKAWDSGDMGYAVIRYEFDNYETCKAEWDAAALEEL